MSSLEACSPDPSWGPRDHTTRGTLEHDNMGLYYTIPKYGLSHHLSWIVAETLLYHRLMDCRWTRDIHLQQAALGTDQCPAKRVNTSF